MSRKDYDNTGKISVAPFLKPVQDSFGEIFEASQKTRRTELDALEGIDLNARLTPFHERLLILERIALNPENHKDMIVKDRPRIALNVGMQTWLWIASQPDIKKMNIRARDVGAFLNRSSVLIQARLRLAAIEG